MKIKLSVIYVYYNTPEELQLSIKSLERACVKIPFEVIIVNNNSPKGIPKKIYEKSNITIINNNTNCGYGKGLNQGATMAKGEYLLLVNPDIIFKKEAIINLLREIQRKPEIGVIAPQLIDEKGNILQSISGMPFLPQSLFIFSFLGKIWSKNPFSVKYHNLNLDRDKEQEVDVAGGACMIVKKSLFEKIRGFDERFFMYFEEADFSSRIKKIGYKILYLPKAKVIHLIGRSSRNKEWIEKTFEQSRFRFFKKYHGLIPALLGEFVLRLFKPLNILLLAILGFSIFLNTYRLSEQMIFIGDQGWFYLSARDMLLTGKIPLVGITASHTWLHQGPLWTYILALIFWLFKFNPVAPAYFTAFLSSITVLLVYKVGKILFSKNVGLIGVVLYATSPLVIINSRMPYHTSPIPLLTLGLIYSVFKWIKGNVYFFPIIIFLMALLYNFELATQIFWFPIGFIFVIGFIEKKKWTKAVLRARILFTSLALFILPMLPIIIYDINHKFVQTIKFFAWVPYRASGSLLADLDKSFIPMLSFFWDSYKNLIFISSSAISLLIILLSLGYMIYFLLSNKNGKNFFSEINVLLIFIIIPMIGFLVNMTPSGAYLPLFFPSVIIATAWIFDKIMNERYLLFPTTILISLIVISNALFSLDAARNKSAYGLYLTERLNAVEAMLKETGGEDYIIRGEGPGSQFESFTMNYEYLAWWLGKPPSKEFAKNLFIISESKNGIIVNKEIINK